MFLFRFSKIWLTILYIALYHFVWLSFCYSNFDYMGYTYNGTSIVACLPSYIIALLPIFVYRGMTKLSSFFSIIIYLLAYIPIILSLQLSEGLANDIVLNYQLLLLIAMISFFGVDRIPFYLKVEVTRKLSFISIVVVTIAITLFLIFAYRSNMRLANFTEIYDLREENSDITSSGINGYFIFWQAKVFYPLLFIMGVLGKRKVVVWLSVVGFVLLYMMTGQKGILLTPLFVFSFYCLLKWSIKVRLDLYKLLVCMITLFSILILCIQGTPIGFAICALFFMRTMCICGSLFVLYVDFFQNNPFTYYSHISIVNKITGMYPYDDVLGKVVTDGGMNANALFWTTDGVASCGYWGVFIISIILVLYLFLLNSIERLNTNNIFVYIVFVPSMTAILNSSLFTYFISHGVFLLIMILLFVKIPTNLKPIKCR